MATNAERTAESRRKLIAAAIDLFASDGVSGTSLAAIGEKAGMSRGAVNFHFGSKENLVGEIGSQAVAAWESNIVVPEIETADDVIAAIDSLLELHRNSLEQQPEMMRLFYSLVFEALSGKAVLHDEVAGLIRRQRSEFASFVARGQDAGIISKDVRPDGLANWFTAALRGLGYHYLVEDRSASLEAPYAELRAAILGRLLPDRQA
jgi:AcrR family transcriptional regulator